MPFTIPNLLTYFRIIVIPLVVVIYYLPFSWAGQAAGILFGLAAVTDWLDGYLARKLNQTSSSNNQLLASILKTQRLNLY